MTGHTLPRDNTWPCDESLQYIEQCYNLEDIRVRHYRSIRNVAVLILAIVYFAAVYLGDNLKLKMLTERIDPRI